MLRKVAKPITGSTGKLSSTERKSEKVIVVTMAGTT
jgi:hypothetical protein